MVGSKFLAFVSDRLTKKMKKMLQEIVEDKKRKNTFDHVAKYLDKQMPKILMLNKK